VPDSTGFEDEPTDVADSIPSAYEPSDFITQALQHSKVKLTWDAEDPERTKITRRKFTKEELSSMDFKSYLASDSDENCEQDDAISKYQALISGFDKEVPEEECLEISFTPGLSEKAERLLEERKDKEVLITFNSRPKWMRLFLNHF
jgi:hypothetical protein